MSLQSKILKAIIEIQEEKKSRKIAPTHALDKEVIERMSKLGYSSECIKGEIDRLESINLVTTGDTINYRHIKVV